MTNDKTETRDKNKVIALTRILDERGGRDLFWDLMSACGVYHKSGVRTLEEANYYNGRKDIGLTILESVNVANPAAIPLMMKENSEDINE